MFKSIKFKYIFPVIYLFFALLAYLSWWFPSFGECKSGVSMFCVPLSIVLQMLVAYPGLILINTIQIYLERIIGVRMTMLDNNDFNTLLLSYLIVAGLLFLIGNFIDRKKKKKH